MYRCYRQAVEKGAQLVVFGELALCGYPPEDLLLKKHFLDDCRVQLEKLASKCTKAAVITGFPEFSRTGKYNSAAVIKNGQISEIYRKERLVNYGVFDEARYFQPADQALVTDIEGFKTVVTICADLWGPDWLERQLEGKGDIDMIVNISASPFRAGKTRHRQIIVESAAARFNVPVFYCNLVGGQDEVVYDGSTMISDSEGNILTAASHCKSDILFAETAKTDNGKVAVTTETHNPPDSLSDTEQLYNALVLATGDYVRKNNFEKGLVALSGGIDSSVVGALASEALGTENITGITLPTSFNSSETRSDAKKLAENLGIEFFSIPVQDILENFDKELGQVNTWNNEGVAYENLQARIRGMIMMSLSNHLGAIVLTSGNKSETAVGYATLYGDTAGGFAVIKDVYKTTVYQLAKFINEKNNREVIPESIINRPPTAELRQGQKDSDALPDYSLLDKILQGYIEDELSAKQLVDRGFEAETVKKVINLVEHNEYKRRQCPPGAKISQKAFGRDRRFPITNKYTEDF
jgi:NAD+ synthase (glutamine-hydrolysing)